MPTAMATACTTTRHDSPFEVGNDAAYRAWRDEKLIDYPARVDELVVDVSDPRALTSAEKAAILARVRKTNMALYASKVRDADKNILRLLGGQFGLLRLDQNMLADDDGITQVRVADANTGAAQHYIPYTNRPLNWHTDGYYNSPARRIQAMLLHCVCDGVSGGENAFMDPEMAYLLLRDENPGYVRALMRPDAMTIPAREDDDGVARGAQSGPVFAIDPHSGALHMRYTARTRSIEWRQDASTQAAVATLAQLLNSGSPYIFRTALKPGMGILSNNVLHDRAGFADDATHRRLLYRARYLDSVGSS